MRRRAEELRREGKHIGAVPTMGALHEGHLSLIRLARGRADTVVTTLFVNPTQFGAGEDFDHYPRPFEADAAKAGEAGTDILFVPEPGEMYPPGDATTVAVERLTLPLEGEFRPSHFRGVTTVVAKLFLIVQPHAAVFGQKDAQQLLVIRRMNRDLHFGVEIVAAPIVREPDGLALSSRNAYLSPEERRQAPVLARALRAADDLVRSGERRATPILENMRAVIGEAPLVRLDYAALVDEENLEPVERLAAGIPVLAAVAARVGATRLIDNTRLTA